MYFSIHVCQESELQKTTHTNYMKTSLSMRKLWLTEENDPHMMDEKNN